MIPFSGNLSRSSWSPVVVAVVALLLGLLAILPRLVRLGDRPLMHDESLFGYYSFQSMKELQRLRELERTRPAATPAQNDRPRIYTHMPILHGPVLILGTACLFDRFGDSIALARGAIAVLSLIAIGACLPLWPRRLRWWLAPLLLTSPVLLFYSRFFRNEMLFCCVLMLGMLGIVRGLGRRPGHVLWSILGMAMMIGLLAIKENAVFVYASAVAFAMLYGLLRFFAWIAPTWYRGLRIFRPRHRPLPPAPPPEKKPGAKKTRNPETFLKPSYAVVVGEAPDNTTPVPPTPKPTPEAVRQRRRLDWTLCLSGWLAGILLGFVLIALAMGAFSGQAPVMLGSADAPQSQLHVNNTADLSKRPLASAMRSLGWLNLYASWQYWEGQHSEHRIAGPLHYHLPILVTYELPLLLLIYIGIAWDGLLRRWRAVLHGSAIVVWLLVWKIWTWIGPPDSGDDAGLFDVALGFLHLQPNLSILIIGLMLAPMLVWSFLMLIEHRPLAAWMGWWAACSLFQYSSAGEKVPWLTVHIILPFYLAVAWIWAPLIVRRSVAIRTVLILFAVGGALIGLRNDLRFIGDNPANPRERLVFNHTSDRVDAAIKNRLALWEEFKDQIPLDQRRVLMSDAPNLGGPSWPGYWYFRHCYSQYTVSPEGLLDQDWDMVIGTKEAIQPLLATLDRDRWNAEEMSLRDHWWAPWPEQALWTNWLNGTPDQLGNPPRLSVILAASFRQWWDYYWYRDTWIEPGFFKVIVLDPNQLRRRQPPD
jgi:predicted membrane-bound mannosyltransferase